LKQLRELLVSIAFFAWFCNPGEGKPNVILIVTEDHALSAFGAFQKRFAELNPTPNLDKLASNGTLFSQAFCSNPMAGPGVASLLTGKHGHLNGFTRNGDKFNGDQTTLPTLLKNNGYDTALFGKWDLGTEPTGFDYWQILADSDEFYNPEFWNPKGKERFEGHSTDVITDLSLDWMKRREQNHKPFFLMIQFNASRQPWMPAVRHVNLFDDVLLPEPPNLLDDLKNRAPPARYQEMEIQRNLDLHYDLFSPKPDGWNPSNALSSNLVGQKNIREMNEEQSSAWQLAWRPKNEALVRESLKSEALLRWKFQRYAKNYLRCLKGIDENIGRLTQNLSMPETRDCLIVYTASHGRFLGEHGWFGTHWTYEESLRVPLILSGKPKPDTAQKIINEALVQDIDVVPTILESLDIAIPKEVQGRSLLPLLDDNNSQPWRQALYFHYHAFPEEQMVPKHRGVRSLSQKLIHYYQFDEWEFFDLSKDPNENHNLYKSEAYQRQIDELKLQLEQLKKTLGDDSDISVMPEEWRRIYRGPDARKKVDE
jgi:arylsulfatase A-like enzyme